MEIKFEKSFTDVMNEQLKQSYYNQMLESSKSYIEGLKATAMAFDRHKTNKNKNMENTTTKVSWGVDPYKQKNEGGIREGRIQDEDVFQIEEAPGLSSHKLTGSKSVKLDWNPINISSDGLDRFDIPSPDVVKKSYDDYQNELNKRRGDKVFGNGVKDQIMPKQTPVIEDWSIEVDGNPVVSSKSDQEWIDEYKSNFMSKNISKKKNPYATSPKITKSRINGISFKAKDLIMFYDLLQEKQIGEVAITGGLSLYLQGKINKSNFSSLELALVRGEYQLDDTFDDIVDDMLQFYDVDENVSKKSFLTENYVVDFLSNNNQKTYKIVEIEFEGRTYNCVSYIDIIDERLMKLLPRIEDYNELYLNTFNINYL